MQKKKNPVSPMWISQSHAAVKLIQFLNRWSHDKNDAQFATVCQFKGMMHFTQLPYIKTMDEIKARGKHHNTNKSKAFWEQNVPFVD